MKRMILSIILVLSLPTGFAFGQDKDEAAARFIMPKQQALSWSEPVECIAIASAGLNEERRELEDFDHPKLSGYIKKGTDRLKLWIDGKNLMVQVEDMKPDRYLLSRHVNKSLVASFFGSVTIPVAYFIVLDESTGYAIWSINEPSFYLISPYPYTQSVYMQCTN